MKGHAVMAEQSVIHSTFVLERSYPKPSEVVFAAFADPARKRRWFVEGENKEVEAFEMDFRVGGAESARYHYVAGMPFTGVPFLNEASYQDIVPCRRIVSASTMTMGERRFSASLVTIEFLATEKGTDLIFTHQGAFFEGADGPEIREAGWGKLLDRLGVEVTR